MSAPTVELDASVTDTLVDSDKPLGRVLRSILEEQAIDPQAAVAQFNSALV